MATTVESHINGRGKREISSPAYMSFEEALYDPQRAIRTLPWSPWKGLSSWVIWPLAFELGLFKLLPRVTYVWADAFTALATFAGLPVRKEGDLVFGEMPLVGALRGVPCEAPSLPQWVGLTWVCLGFWILGSRLPERFRPFALWLKVISAVLLTAIVYFAWSPAGFPYDFAQYYRSRVTGSLALLTVVPILFGLFYYPLEPRGSRRLGVTCAYLAYLVAALPVELVITAIVCHALSLAWLPLAFILVGPLLQIAWFSAFFSVGLSQVDTREMA